VSWKIKVGSGPHHQRAPSIASHFTNGELVDRLHSEPALFSQLSDNEVCPRFPLHSFGMLTAILQELVRDRLHDIVAWMLKYAHYVIIEYMNALPANFKIRNSRHLWNLIVHETGRFNVQQGRQRFEQDTFSLHEIWQYKCYSDHFPVHAALFLALEEYRVPAWAWLYPWTMLSFNDYIDSTDAIGPDHREAAVEVFVTNIGAEPKEAEALRALAKAMKYMC